MRVRVAGRQTLATGSAGRAYQQCQGGGSPRVMSHGDERRAAARRRHVRAHAERACHRLCQKYAQLFWAALRGAMHALGGSQPAASAQLWFHAHSRAPSFRPIQLGTTHAQRAAARCAVTPARQQTPRMPAPPRARASCPAAYPRPGSNKALVQLCPALSHRARNVCAAAAATSAVHACCAASSTFSPYFARSRAIWGGQRHPAQR